MRAVGETTWGAVTWGSIQLADARVDSPQANVPAVAAPQLMMTEQKVYDQINPVNPNLLTVQR